MALIANTRGEVADAKKRYAEHVLSAAARTQSPFRYHHLLGLVGLQDTSVETTLRELATGTIGVIFVQLKDAVDVVPYFPDKVRAWTSIGIYPPHGFILKSSRKHHGLYVLFEIRLN